MPNGVRSESLRVYVPWRTRSLPLNWPEEFARSAPFKMEIGFGNGDYLVKSAAGEPETNFIGVEMTWGSIKRASAQCFRRDLKNVRLLWDDARTALAWNFGEKCLQEITALYPCPWPKKRHAKFRLFQPSFISLCNSRLIDGGTLTVVTDSAVYKDEILETNTLDKTGMKVELEVIAASFETKYEKKWEETGQTEFYRITFHKVKHLSIPNPEVQIMKHHLVPTFDPESFAPRDEKNEFSVQFKQFIFDQKKNIGLQEVFTHEGTLEQHFYVRIKKQENGWKIHPAGGPPLLPVRSVQRALDIVKETAEAQG
jgi:tRNA (guanine-N7-)-methyltransferase